MAIFKKKKEKVRTFENGKEVPDQAPDLEIPVPLPQNQNFKPGQEVTLDEHGQYQVVSDCFICHDHLYYIDATGVWRECPRCNSPTEESPPYTDEDDDESDQEIKPKTGYSFRFCSNCGQENEVHNTKKEFICEHCDTINKFQKPKGGK